MGFNIGYGYLHRIPAPSTDAVVFDAEAPMQTAFELAQQLQQHPSPPGGDARASMERKSSDLPSRPPLPTHAHARRRASHSGKKAVGIDDILREGEEKSVKEDIVQVTTETGESVLPPPPKRQG